MSVYRKRKNSMKQADKELNHNEQIIDSVINGKSEYFHKETVKKSLMFQIEEQKDDETLLQTGKVWCEDCMDWIEQVEKKDNYLCCYQCGNGVVLLT